MADEETKDEYFHDLESLFYVLCWTCTVQARPNGQKRPKSDFDYMTIVHKWLGKGDSDFSTLGNVKQNNVIIETNFLTTVIKGMHPYFSSFSDVLKKMRKLLFTHENCKDDDFYQEIIAKAEKNLDHEPKDLRIRQMIPIENRVPRCLVQDFKDICADGSKTLPVEPNQPVSDSQSKSQSSTEPEQIKIVGVRKTKFVPIVDVKEEPLVVEEDDDEVGPDDSEDSDGEEERDEENDGEEGEEDDDEGNEGPDDGDVFT